MCQFSATAENTRDARKGEDLVVSRAPHGASHWLTEPRKPGCAVCIPNAAVLAVQIPNGAVRGAHFEQRKQHVSGHFDFLNFLDGEKESVPLDELRLGTGVRVLQLESVGRPVVPRVPAAISSTVHDAVESEEDEENLVPVGVAGRSHRLRERLSSFGRW
jgi:hypothetical protein